VTNIADLSNAIGRSQLEKGVVDVGSDFTRTNECRIQVNWLGGINGPPEIAWLLRRVAQYFNDAFFFSPFRHSQARMPARRAEGLSQDGANLA
jgi:hypothetical protein